MPGPTLYRKRLIPMECVLLANDEILLRDKEIMVTSWKPIKPRKDIHHGYSTFWFNEGLKISKFYKSDTELLYWYCDIVDYDYNEETDTYIVTDLLADVIIYPDGFVKVVDLDELVEAKDSDLISCETLKLTLIRISKLLNLIYSGEFDKLKEPIEKCIK